MEQRRRLCSERTWVYGKPGWHVDQACGPNGWSLAGTAAGYSQNVLLMVRRQLGLIQSDCSVGCRWIWRPAFRWAAEVAASVSGLARWQRPKEGRRRDTRVVIPGRSSWWPPRMDRIQYQVPQRSAGSNLELAWARENPSHLSWAAGHCLKTHAQRSVLPPSGQHFRSYVSGVGAAGGGNSNLSTLARDELVLLSCLLPQHWLNQHRRPSGKVFATDASEEGGGACETTDLSEWGHQRIHGFSYAEDGLEGALADDILVIEMFAGMGGLKQALELIGLMPQGVISVDTDSISKRITRQHCRHAICHDDVKTITKEMVSEWRRQFPRAKRVLIAGGWPCVHHSSLNVDRQGSEGSTSQLLVDMIQVRDWLVEVQYDHSLPGWEVLELYENVVMDEQDLNVQSRRIGWLPIFLEAAEVGHCRRPRLYWLRNIPLVEGTDLQVQKKSRIRDLDLPLDRVTIKTTRPDMQKFLNSGAKKLAQEREPFYTFTRPILRKEPPASPAGIERASQKAIQRWRGDGYRLPPYAYEDANLAVDKSGPRRLAPDEQLRMLGFTSSHLNLKQKLTADQKGHFIGNSFSAVAVARLLAGLAVSNEAVAGIDVTEQLWLAWDSLETPVGKDQQPWRCRFGQGARADHGVVAMRRRVLPPADVPLRAKLDPKHRLTDAELLAYLLTRQAVHKGCDIRMDRNIPFTYGSLCRHSIDPGNWKWKVLLSYRWKQGGQHINVLETTAVLDLARKLARDPKNHGLRSILLIDNIVSLSVQAKGRSSSRALHAPLRRLAGVLLAADLRFYLAWIKSGWDPADGPSRWKARL